MGEVYWLLLIALGAVGVIALLLALWTGLRIGRMAEGLCFACGYPQTEGIARCPECGKRFTCSQQRRRMIRRSACGAVVIAATAGVCAGIWHRAGGVTQCLPNSVLFLLAQRSNGDLAFREYRQRATAGHAAFPDLVAPRPGQTRYADLCLRIAARSADSSRSLVLAIDAMAVDIEPGTVADRLDRRWREGSALERLRFVSALLGVHGRSPHQWHAMLPRERRDVMLEDPDVDVRLSAANMLWACDRDPRAMAVFAHSLAQPNDRQTAVVWLTSPELLDDTDSTLGPDLLAALRESPVPLQGLLAMRQLARIDDATLRGLIDMEWTTGSTILVYQEIVQRTGPRACGALDALLVHLASDNQRVRNGAMHAIRALGQDAAKAIPDLVGIGRDARHAPGDYGEAVAFSALVEIAGADAVVFAIEALHESPSALVQQQALQVLSRYGEAGDTSICLALRAATERCATAMDRDTARALLDSFCE